MNYAQAEKKLNKWDQLHLLKFYDELDKEGQERLLQSIADTDFTCLKARELMNEVTKKKGEYAPLSAMTLDAIAENAEKYEEIGLAAIKEGKVGAVLLAGGMGTRLGSDGPKGIYDIGETKPVYIFQRLIENTLEVVNKAGSMIPFFIMTSDVNHDTTVSFFEEHDYFGYDKAYVYFFKQEMAPASDYDGKVFLEAKDKVAASPNGNGGWFTSMLKAGLDTVLAKRGLEWLNVFAVDNVLQKIADPVFTGAVIDRDVQVGAKVVAKASPDEKVGVMCLEGNRPSIVEYYELTKEMMDEKDASGKPAYNYGVILNYMFQVEALYNCMEKKLQLHVVEKKIPYVDDNGNLVKPEKPNGYKYEQLVLDMIHEMKSCLPFEVDREKEFAPIKNKTGVDSVESARELLKMNGYEL